MIENTGKTIRAWEQDPGKGGQPDGGGLLDRPVPVTDQTPFPTQITGTAPPADNYSPGTPGFRYWAAADALRRTSDFWGGLLKKHAWHPKVGATLRVILDEGVDLNAYYDRHALNFFHAAVHGRMVFSGESPDIVCHEFGHAILDSIRPQLWDVAAFEPPAFHESFGDMSAILTALQLPSVRTGVLQETNDAVYRSSRLSRLAEQLGWAIRQSFPDAVEPDCLRNAVNSFFYQNPDDLPTSAPGDSLSSEPHSFSRVFTGAFFHALGLMFASSATNPTEADLQRVSVDMGAILIGAIRLSPVVPEYFAQIGAHMIKVANAKSGAYGDAIKTAMVKHGILSVPGIAAVGSDLVQLNAATGVAAAPPSLSDQELDISSFGFSVDKIYAASANEAKRFGVAGAAPTSGDTRSQPGDRVALGYFEDLIRRGKLDDGGFADPQKSVAFSRTVKTHRLEKAGDRVLLRRVRIDCGFRSTAANAARPAGTR